jgi:hypothetical protein
MKKLTIDKGEEIAEVIDRLLAVEDSHITLVIPKNSSLGKSASNFRLLKREAGLAEKTVTVESSDENVVAFAVANGLTTPEMLHMAGSGRAGDSAGAQQQRSRANGISDIIPKKAVSDEDDEEEALRQHKKGPAVKLTVPDEPEADEPETDEEEEKREEADQKSFFDPNRFFKPRVVSGDTSDPDDESGGGISGKAVGWIIGIIVVLAVAFYAVTILFGHAQVTIDFTQTPWNYQNNFVADKAASGIVPGGTTIPAQVFTTQKNITQLFPATGATASVSAKAQGTITIYNDYGSAPQDLVATTRFQTPDGMIFRLTTDVTVPGATVAAGGAITPSSVQAPIAADQSGPSYNIGPVAKLTIPGFQKDPTKYTGFYGTIASPTTGGFVGTKSVPTTADIANAKTKTTAILQSDLQDGLTASYPGNFKILDGATDIQVTKLIVSTSTDTNGNFSVFGEASLTAIGFDEAAFKGYLLSVAESSTAGIAPSSTFKTLTLNYSNVQADFAKGQVGFALSAQGTLEPAFSTDDFASSIAGTSISSARNMIQGLPELSDGTISVWPIWLWNMPSDPKKIQITAN